MPENDTRHILDKRGRSISFQELAKKLVNSGNGAQAMWMMVLHYYHYDACRFFFEDLEQSNEMRFLVFYMQKDFVEVCNYANLSPEYVKRKIFDDVKANAPEFIIKNDICFYERLHKDDGYIDYVLLPEKYRRRIPVLRRKKQREAKRIKTNGQEL